MDLQIKTFRIQGEADERALNEFLAGKIVRHWATTYNPTEPGASGAWDVFIAYEIRMNEARPAAGRNDHSSAQPAMRRAQDSHSNSRTPERREPKPREKPPREEYQPQIPEKDLPLYEAVRKWRNARARDERVKPFSFFNNRTLEGLVTAKPASASDLKALVPEMEPNLWERYGNELLGFMEAAGSANGHSETSVPAESNAGESS